MSNYPNNSKSVFDNVTDSLSPILREVTDVQLALFGTQTQILRLSREVYQRQTTTVQGTSVTGDFDLLLEKYLYSNTVITYPFQDMEIFVSRVLSDKGYETADTNIHGIDVTDILPIKMEVMFNGDYYEDPIELKKDDLIVDIFWDANNNPLPIILQIMRLRGSFFGKNQIKKSCELSLYRKDLSNEIQKIIDDYLQWSADVRQELKRDLNAKGYSL